MEIGINGLGRIGRCLFRQIWETKELNCVVFNDPNIDINNLVYLLKYDSIYGKNNASIRKKDDSTIFISEGERFCEVKFFSELKIDEIPWNTYGVTQLVDCSGEVWDSYQEQRVLETGVERIFLTHWNEEVDCVFLLGYSDIQTLQKKQVISLGICDTAAVVPVLNKLHQQFVVGSCSIVTLHPWLGYQNLLDGPVNRSVRYQGREQVDYQMGRESVNCLMPKPTNLENILKTLFPDLKDKLQVMAYRVPTDTVSAAEIFIQVQSQVSEKEVLTCINHIPDNIIGKNRESLISRDFTRMDTPGIVDLKWLRVDGNMIHLTVWYDNEWGFVSGIKRTLYEIYERE